MVLRIEDKKAIVAEVAEVAGRSLSAVAAEYRGLTVSELTELRSNARKIGVYMRVVRNTLARRALQDTPFSCMQDILVGPLLLAFSQEDPGAAARLIRDFAKDHDKLVVKALSVGGKLLAPKDLNALANLPTREQALATLMSVMLAPITQFVRTLAEPHAKLARTVAAVRDQKQAA
ncbi:MAG TPA: 50S ribosomal protein L10 [Gammaproteobacteria bacterium]|nr:50S ribosomal protein L10 [Gammaproteobacteria bacterium]